MSLAVWNKACVLCHGSSEQSQQAHAQAFSLLFQRTPLQTPGHDSGPVGSGSEDWL